MTEENHQTESSSSSTRSSPLVQAETHTSTLDVSTKIRDIKKEKCRAMTKVVIRRLPPSMNQAQFIEQISPMPEHDHLYFVKADMSLGQYAYSRAYINFTDQRDIFIFREKFDNYVFVDSKGTEYPAVVEFAPFQRLPKKRIGKKKDMKCASIETDPYYVRFLESLQNLDGDSPTAQPKTEYSYQPTDSNTKKVTTTPLLEYLKQRKQEKLRLKNEKREERRHRDQERRRAKDEPMISKVLKNPEMEKETSRDAKEEKEKQPGKETRTRNKKEDKIREKIAGRERDGKAQTKQQQQTQMQQSFNRGEERNRDREGKHQKKHEDKRVHGKREDKDRESTKDERKFEQRISKEEKKCESKDESKDTKEKKVEEKRGKSYEKMRLEKKRLAENKKSGGDGGGGKMNLAAAKAASVKKEDREFSDKKEKKGEVLQASKSLSVVDDTAAGRTANEPNKIIEESNRRLEQHVDDDTDKSQLRLEHFTEVITGKKSGNRRKDDQDAEINLSKLIFDETDNGIEFDDTERAMKKNRKIVLRRSSLESGAEAGGGDAGRLRRHKSLDGGDEDNFRQKEIRYKDKDKKDPRMERRIRNKDRPAMEIYRPGMGRFSKQRLEREKSINDDRASLSQSPTPSGPSFITNPKTFSKQASGRAGASSPSNEVRSKRSASPDLQ